MRFRLVLLLAMLVSANGIAAAETPDQSMEIAKLRLLGAFVEGRDQSLPGRPVTHIRFIADTRFGDKWAHLLKSFDHLTHLDLRGTAITDAGLNQIGSLKSLERVYVDWRTVTPAGIRELRKRRHDLRISYGDQQYMETLRWKLKFKRGELIERQIVVEKQIAEVNGRYGMEMEDANPQELDRQRKSLEVEHAEIEAELEQLKLDIPAQKKLAAEPEFID